MSRERAELPPIGTVVGGWIVHGEAERDITSNRTRVLLECRSCGGLVSHALQYLRDPSAGCRACGVKARRERNTTLTVAPDPR